MRYNEDEAFAKWQEHQAAAERDGNLGEVIDRRVQVYGNPVETFARIAEVWSGILGHHVNPVEVPLMMAGMKMVRAQVMPDYSDNSDDIDGYMDIFRQLVGEDMIHARTVNEFIEQKWPTRHVAQDEPPAEVDNIEMIDEAIPYLPIQRKDPATVVEVCAAHYLQDCKMCAR